jgi:hypothetical protein
MGGNIHYFLFKMAPIRDRLRIDGEKRTLESVSKP